MTGGPRGDDRARTPADATLRRVAIVGSTGSGKTTLARTLARLYGVQHIELDALHWGPNWTETPGHIFRERVDAATASESWVTDGNYSSVREMLWDRAGTIVWLDYPLWLVYARLIPRTFRRVVRRERLWNGNRERLWEQFFSRDSLLLWALTTYRRRRREYTALLRRPEYAHLHVLRFRTPRQTERWLQRCQGGARATSERGR